MIFWILYYLITGIMIISFLFKESYVSSKINVITSKIVNILKIEKLISHFNRQILQYISYILGFIAIYLYIFKIDKMPDENIFIKIYIIHLIMIINILCIFFDKKQYILVILNTALIFSSTLLFNISDKYYTITLFIIIMANIILIIKDRNRFMYHIQKIANGFYVLLLVVILQSTYIGNYVIPTGSMLPTIQIGDRIFSNNIIYKFKNPKLGDIISFKEPIDDRLMYTKRITGIPGTTISITNDGELLSDGKNANLGRKYLQNGYINTKPIYIPKKNDKVKLYSILKFSKNNYSFMGYITPEEFYKQYKDRDSYIDLIGRFNSTAKNEEFVYDFVYKVVGTDYETLPILDFKYSKSTIDKLLKGEEITLQDNYYIAMGDNSANSLDSRYFGYVKENRIRGKLLFIWFPFNRIGKI